MSNILLVKVTTIDMRTLKETSKVIDHNDPASRAWLGKHCYWALRNKHEVTTTPIEVK